MVAGQVSRRPEWSSGYVRASSFESAPTFPPRPPRTPPVTRWSPVPPCLPASPVTLIGEHFRSPDAGSASLRLPAPASYKIPNGKLPTGISRSDRMGPRREQGDDQDQAHPGLPAARPPRHPPPRRNHSALDAGHRRTRHDPEQHRLRRGPGRHRSDGHGLERPRFRRHGARVRAPYGSTVRNPLADHVTAGPGHIPEGTWQRLVPAHTGRRRHADRTGRRLPTDFTARRLAADRTA